MRYEPEHKTRTRDRIVRNAARKLRAEGLSGPGVAGVMKASGLTVGGFYKHFRSKDELLSEAIAQAFADSENFYSSLQTVPREDRWKELVRLYLSRDHCDHPDIGCPVAALAPEIARAKLSVRKRISGVIKEHKWVELMPGASAAERERNFFIILSAMVGAVSIARVLTEPAERVLASVRNHLLRSFWRFFLRPLDYMHNPIKGTDERNLMNLRNRTILITGGSAGIGLAFALKFLELGNEVIVTGRRQRVLDEVKAKCPKLHTIQSDVADPAQIAALAARMKADFPKLDVLMNNAGIMLYKNLKAPATDLAGLMAEVNINVGGVIGMTSAFIDILTANKGTVINVSSGLAFVPLPAAPIYSATKAAIHSYTQSLRFQLEETGVEVIDLMPPAVKTEMTTELAEGGGTVISTDELVKQSFALLKAGALEIRPGQSKQLAFLRRLAPDFINRQLWKASRNLVPAG